MHVCSCVTIYVGINRKLDFMVSFPIFEQPGGTETSDNFILSFREVEMKEFNGVFYLAYDCLGDSVGLVAQRSVRMCAGYG